MFIALIAAMTSAVAQPAVAAEMQPLQFLVGHCLRGEFKNGQHDTHCFESVFDGKHVRDRHEVTGGTQVYRGEAIYSWNAATGKVEYTYWNSLGGVSRGTMTPGVKELDFGDEVHETPSGEKLRISTKWLLHDDGSYETVSTSGSDPTGSQRVHYKRVASRSAAK